MEYILAVGKQNRDFSIFCSSIGEPFVAELMKAWARFEKYLDNESTEATYWFQSKCFLQFVADDERLRGLRLFLRKEDSLSPSVEFMQWQNALTLYRVELQQKHKTSLVTANNKCMGVRKFICDFCANQGLVPHELSIEGFKVKVSLGRDSTFLSRESLQFLGQSEESFARIIADLDDDDVDLDADLVELLCVAIEKSEGDVSSICRVELAVKHLNNRIEQLRSKASELYVDYICKTRLAEKWSKNDIYIHLSERFLHLLSDQSVKGKERGNVYIDIFKEFPLEVLVTFAKRHLHGRLPLVADGVIYDAFFSRAKSFGIARCELESYLGLSSSAMVAGYTFILIETTGNSGSIWDLKVNDLAVSDGEESHYRLNWIKRRSKGHESMYKIFQARTEPLAPNTLTVKDVFEHQLECRSVFTDQVRAEDADHLFLHYFKNNTKLDASGQRQYVPSKPSIQLLNRNFKQLCKKASSGVWESTPKAVRGTKLLLTGMITKDTTAVMAEGLHRGTTMADRYTYHIPEVLRREKAVRDFLDWFEALVTIDIEGFALRLGIDEIAYSKRLEEVEEIRRADLQEKINQQFGGVHCEDPMAGVQAGTVKGETCTKIDKCLTCKNRRGIFVASLNNLVNVMHWNEALLHAKTKLGDSDYARWQLWDLFTGLVLQKFAQNPSHQALFRRARELQKKEMNPYWNVIPSVELV